MAVKVHWFQIEPNLKEYEYEFTGLSTDEKPQDERVALNSMFLELDTGDFYYLKQQKTEGTPAIWDKVGGGGSGPDPSSDDDLIVLRTNFSPSGTRMINIEYEDVSMSASEIAEAVNNNKNVVIIIDNTEVAYFDHMASSIGTKKGSELAYFASILMDPGTAYYVDESNHFVYEGGLIGPIDPPIS